MSNFVLRTLSGLVLSILVVGSFWMGPIPTAVLFLLWTVVGSYEFNVLTGSSQHRTLAGVILGAAFYIFFYLIGADILPSWSSVLMLPVFALLFVFELVLLRPGFAVDFARIILGWVYISVPMALISSYAFIPGIYSKWLPIGFFIMLWVNDSGAYLLGRAFGRTPLFPRVSPKKTWEGMIGGALATAAVGWLFSTLPAVKREVLLFDTVDWIVLALVVSVFATLGDLVESHLKRTADVKDSGSFIPGHGGVLDRFDGYLLAMPMAFSFVYLIYHL